jgi:ABC-2 type transport system permease protein
MGAWLLPFVLNLVISGWIIGVLTTSLIMRFGQEAEILAWSLVFLFQPISCVFYPLEVLPTWLQAVAWINPAAHVFEGMREVLTGTRAPLFHLAWAGALNAALLIGAVMLFYKTFAYCKVQGSLVRVGE